MNLQKLKIANYKRLKAVELDFPSTGVIGVVGGNGAGKSTLFEAILWVLFGPQAGIGATTVTHRRLGGDTSVELTVEQDDTVYTVARKARASGRNPDAVIYRNDEPEPFVKGVRDVTRFVQGTLLHMNVTAFTTTFFARQKELEFFSGVGNTERRQQVQRLLDLDAIEIAHANLRAEGKAAKETLDAARSRLEGAGGNRDLDAEHTAATTDAAFARAALAEHDAALAEVGRRHTEARAAHTALLDLKQRHDGYETARQRIAVDLARERQREENACHNLATLAERETRADALAPDVARLPAVAAALRAAQAAADHARAVERATLAVRGAEDTVGTLTGQVDALVADLEPLRDLLFTWDEVAEAAPGLARARTLATTLTGTAPLLAGSTEKRDAWNGLTRHAEERDRATADAKKHANAVAQIEGRLNVVRAGADPAASVDALTRQERELTERGAEQQGRYAALRTEHKRYSDLLKRWQGADADEPCPTCGRPFSEEDAGTILASLRRSIEDCTARGKAIAADIKATDDEARDVRLRLQTDQKRLDDARALEAQRVQAMRQEADAREKVDVARRTLVDALAVADRHTPPTEAELRDLDGEIRLLTRAANATTQAMGLARQITQAEAAAVEKRDALATLGPDTYDADAHAALHAEHDRLIARKAEAAGIAQQLAARPEIEARRDAARHAIAAGEAETATIDAEQAALGFDADALAAAATRVTTLIEERDERNRGRMDAHIALSGAEAAVAAIERERGRIAALRADVATHEATAHRYRLMDDGFAAFSRDLAARIRPRLGDHASELVERMTNGRYVRMLFNDDYAPALYDDEDQYFPVGNFSGGERDVAALAARIALSQLLAARGGHKVGFMVLDEVFGSLDGERRTLVLDALASMREFIPQLFIISHVDDVRLSPVMDEVWTVAALPDGTSEVRRKGFADAVLTDAMASVA